MTNPTENNQSYVRHEDSSKKYFTLIPNCVYSLGLDPYEFRLYLQYCAAANEQTKISWWSNKSLAKLCCMSERKLRECKSSLAQARHELENKPLIHIEHRKTAIGDWDTDIITVMDIWPDNMKLILGKSDGGGGARPAGGVGHNMPEGGAQYADKQYSCNNTNKNNISPELPKVPACAVKSAKASKENKKFSIEITDCCETILSELRKVKPDYKFSKTLASKWCEQLDLMVRIDKREPEKLLRVFRWGISDKSYWRPYFFKANPVKYLREKFDQLDMKMSEPTKETPKKEYANGWTPETPQQADFARINTEYFIREKAESNGALDHCFISNGFLNNKRNRSKDASIKVPLETFKKLIETVAGVEYCGV